MAKLNIDFVLIDESVVRNGFRCLMSGAELDEFKQNPVMLFMHNRASAGVFEAAENDILLPIGKWYDIRIEGSRLLAKPDFDDSDEFAKKIENKVKGGYLNGSSVWLDPVASDDDAELKLQGQIGVTVTKWGVLEASIVDIPNCKNALAIRNSAGKKIVLSNNSANNDVLEYLKTFSTNKNMDKKLLLAVGLPETATEAEYLAKLNQLQLAAQRATESDTEIAQLKKDLSEEKQKLAQKEAADKTKMETELVDGAITAKKILAGDRDKYLKLAAADFETTKTLLDGLKSNPTIESKLSGGNTVISSMLTESELQELMKLSGRELYMSGKIERLKEISPEIYRLKFKEYYGVEPEN